MPIVPLPDRRLPIAALTLALLTISCGNGETQGTGGTGGGGGSSSASGTGAGAGPPVLGTVHGAPTAPSKEPATSPHALEGYATSLSTSFSDAGARVLIGTTKRVYGVDAEAPIALEIVGDEPNLPLETGEVKALAPYADGVLAATDTGVFFTKGDVLQISGGNDSLHPLGITGMTARIADDDGDGKSEAHLVLLGKEGGYELDGSKLTTWKVDGETGPPTAIYAQKSRLYMAFGDHVYEVDKDAKLAYPLVFDVGNVSAIACSSPACEDGSLLYFASDRGLVERGTTGDYTIYPLAKEGEPPLAVETFALDPTSQRLYALAGNWVLRVRAGEVPDAVATRKTPAFPRRMTVDKKGDVWAGEGQSVESIALGTPLSFGADVAPIMHTYCATCHQTGIKGAPKIDFESYEVMLDLLDVVQKRVVDEGSMPPATAQQVPKEKIQILKEWAASKHEP